MREKALIFCVTPLHCLIAERIVKLNPDKSFYAIICIWPTMNREKITYYGKRLISICEGGECIDDKFYGVEFSRITETVEILRTKWRYRRYRGLGITEVYASHYSNTMLQVIMGGLTKNFKAFTFDDGTMNLDPELYEKNADRRVGYLHTCLGLVSSADFVSKIVAHYTLYDAPNARQESPIKIELFSSKSKDSGSQVLGIEPVVRIFLGQPIFENISDDDLSLSIEATQNAIKISQSDLYLPHPREDYRLGGVKYIDTLLVFEDYILQELERNPTTTYIVSGFFSSSMLNMLGHPRLKFVSYRPSNVPERWNMMYSIIRNLGITIVDY